MVDNAFGDFFLTDVDDELFEEDDEIIAPPVVVPVTPPPAPAVQAVPAVQAQPERVVAEPSITPVATPVPRVAESAPPTEVVPARSPVPTPEGGSREARLLTTLNRLMSESPEIQAAALVSLDGFTMASALPEGMQEDRVGAMSAAILGLGERAAAELGKGSLSQVFIEGDGGYVMLIAAGKRAALTCLADTDAKLGLVLYDMRTAATAIAQILG